MSATAELLPISTFTALAGEAARPAHPNVEALDTTDSRAIRLFAEVLKQAKYPSGGDEALGRELASLHRKRDIPSYLQRLQHNPTLRTLNRLFALQEAVTLDDARTAFAPLELSDAVQIGVVALSERGVQPRVAISVCDGLFILHDPAMAHSAGKTLPDHVLGVSPPTLLLASLTFRQPAILALDLGTGCGIQALLMAQHCQQVIGTDINQRALNFARFNALLNGISNVEFRFGSLFEPVADLTFNLIVTNPPYVISPESKLMFRDGGSSADGFCADLIRALPKYLAEGGFACMLANWAHFQDEHWSGPVRKWVDRSGCDAWILHGADHEPWSYAADWNRHLERTSAEKALQEWNSYYEQLGIRSITSGGLVLRKRTAPSNWARIEELGERTVSLSEAIERVFRIEDFLASHSDEALLEMRFRLRPAHQIVQTVQPEGDDYTIREMRLESTEDPPFQASLDANTFHLLRQSNGTQTLRETLVQVTTIAGGDLASGFERGLTIVRGLLAHGILAPCTNEKT